MAKEKKGYMNCETCGSKVVVKENEHGTLSYRCDECDAAPYAKAGTGQHAAWTKKMGLSAKTGTPQVEVPKKTETPTQPQPKPASEGVGFFG